MVYGAILQKGESSFTDLYKILEKMGGFHREYNWLVSDHVCTTWNDDVHELLQQDKLPGLLSASEGRNTWYNWMSGEELEKASYYVIQWFWGVFSAFDTDVTEEEAVSTPIPYSDMNEELWKLPLRMQNPRSKVEIVAFDCSCCIIYTTDKAIYDRFREVYPLAEDLEEHLLDFQKQS